MSVFNRQTIEEKAATAVKAHMSSKVENTIDKEKEYELSKIKDLLEDSIERLYTLSSMLPMSRSPRTWIGSWRDKK